MKKCNYIWLDLETTGTDPRLPGARILEVAATLAYDSAEGDMRPHPDFQISLCVRTTREQFDAAWAGMPAKDAEFVRNMHTYNGLIGDCTRSNCTLEQIDTKLVGLAHALMCGGEPKDLLLAGDSVHFDREWIRVHLPKFSACLSHRVFNVSTLKACARTWGAWPEHVKKDDAHRAWPDVLASLDAAKMFKADYRARLDAAGVLADATARMRAEAKNDSRAQYQCREPEEHACDGTWEGNWIDVNYCKHLPAVLYAFRRPKAKWVACTRAEAHAFGGQARSPGTAWVDFDHKVYPPGGDVAYRVDATRTNELSPVVVLAPDIFRAIPPIKGFALSLAGGRYAIERTLIPVGTYLG